MSVLSFYLFPCLGLTGIDITNCFDYGSLSSTLNFFNLMELIRNFMGQVGNLMGHVGNLMGQVGNLLGQAGNPMGEDGTFIGLIFKIEIWYI